MTPSARQPTMQSPDSGHFLMLAALTRPALDREWLNQELRRMGLQPRRVDAAPAAGERSVSGGGWLISFGALTARVSQVNGGGSQPPLADAEVLRVEPVAPVVPEDPVAAARELLKLAVLLIDLCGAQQLYWSPAALWSDAAACRAAVAEMLDSGMPPVLHLVAFIDVADGGIMTRGLSHFCGQEVWLHPADGLDRLAQMRRLARLAVDMTMNGPITAPRRFPGLVGGEAVMLSPRPAIASQPPVVEVRIVPE